METHYRSEGADKWCFCFANWVFSVHGDWRAFRSSFNFTSHFSCVFSILNWVLGKQTSRLKHTAEGARPALQTPSPWANLPLGPTQLSLVFFHLWFGRPISTPPLWAQGITKHHSTIEEQRWRQNRWDKTQGRRGQIVGKERQPLQTEAARCAGHTDTAEPASPPPGPGSWRTYTPFWGRQTHTAPPAGNALPAQNKYMRDDERLGCACLGQPWPYARAVFIHPVQPWQQWRDTWSQAIGL